MGLDPALYAWLETFSPYLVGWTALFTAATSVRVVRRLSSDGERVPHSAAVTELAALPLAALQSACFVKALGSRDVISALLFLWWGPGFVATALYVGACALRKTKPAFFRYRVAISWACKLNYLAFALVFLWLGRYALLFVYSAWIINDQYGLAFLSMDADRLRRTFHDYWIVRAAYPLGLLAPYFVWDIPFAWAYRPFGAALLLLWSAGVVYAAKRHGFDRPPSDSALLRNIIYWNRDPS